MRYRCVAKPPYTGNAFRAGDTEAGSLPRTTTGAYAEGDTKASRENAAGVSPPYRFAAKSRP
jgi:hypothetical protein